MALHVAPKDGHMTNTPLSNWLDQQIGENKPFESNREFAKAAGVSASGVNSWRHGAQPSLRILTQISDQLDVPLEKLVIESEELADADAALKMKSPELYNLLTHFLNTASDDKIQFVLGIIRNAIALAMRE
jgi:transcriptional regulator with XRE-family HTH domain